MSETLESPALGFTIDYMAEKTTEVVQATVRYNTTSPSAQSRTPGSGEKLKLEPGKTYYFCVVEDGLEGEVRTLTVPERPAKPDRSVITLAKGSDEDHTNISLPITREYYIGASAPETSAVWTAGTGAAHDVAANTGDKLYIRTRTTDQAFASAAEFYGDPLFGPSVLAWSPNDLRLPNATTGEEYSVVIRYPEGKTSADYDISGMASELSYVISDDQRSVTIKGIVPNNNMFRIVFYKKGTLQEVKQYEIYAYAPPATQAKTLVKIQMVAAVRRIPIRLQVILLPLKSPTYPALIPSISAIRHLL